MFVLDFGGWIAPTFAVTLAELNCTCAAGNSDIFAQTCSGTCYNDFVIGPPSNYDNAYFEVRSVRVFGTSSAVDIRAVSNGVARNSTGGVSLAGSSGKRHVKKRGTRAHRIVGH